VLDRLGFQSSYRLSIRRSRDHIITTMRSVAFFSLVGAASAAMLKAGSAYNFSKDQEKDCAEGRFLPGCDADKFARYALVFCATDASGSIKPLADPSMLDLKARRGAAAAESPKEEGMKKWMTDFISKESMSTCPLMASVQAGAPTSPCDYKVEVDGELKKWNAATIAGI